MTEQFLSFCQLCDEQYGEAGSLHGQIYELALYGLSLEFCELDGELFCRGAVSDLEDVVDMRGCLEALLGGNCFWGGTYGATLSLKDDSVYLTDRLAMEYFEDADALKDYVQEFYQNVMQWRERVALYRKPEAEER